MTEKEQSDGSKSSGFWGVFSNPLSGSVSSILTQATHGL